MRLVTLDEAFSLLARAGLSPNPAEARMIKHDPVDEFSSAVRDRIVPFARELASHFEGRTLFCASEIGVWESSGDDFLFERFLASGLEAPFHLEDEVAVIFEREDRGYLQGVILLSLLFVYGGFVHALEGHLTVSWSHDEFIFVLSPNLEKKKEMETTFEAYGLSNLYRNA